MRWIAHRGNVRGRDIGAENRPAHLQRALDAGFDVETDVWAVDGRWLLGHDAPEHPVEPGFLVDPRVWCHAKNHDALSALLALGANVFGHDKDAFVVTSKGVGWAFPGQPIGPSTVCVMPERSPGAYTEQEISACHGVCSDYVGDYLQRATAALRFGMIISGRIACYQERLLPQLRRYLAENATHWIDVHVSLNAPERPQLPGLDAPFIATLRHEPYVEPEALHKFVNKAPETNRGNALSMFYNNWKAWAAMKKYAARNGVRYDWWVKFRPDVVADRLPDPPPPPPVDGGDDKDTVVYLPAQDAHSHVHDWGLVNDQVALGRTVAAGDAYFNLYEHIAEHVANEPRYLLHPETMLAYELHVRGVRIATCPFAYCGLDLARFA